MEFISKTNEGWFKPSDGGGGGGGKKLIWMDSMYFGWF